MGMYGGHERRGAPGVVSGQIRATCTEGNGTALERVPPGTSAPAAPERRVRGRAAGAGPETGTVLGRLDQSRLVRGAVRGRSVVEFTGECGSGRTALLRAAAPDVYLRVGGTAFEDFLQDLVREFYVCPPGTRRLSVEECTRALAQVGAVIALDDVDYPPEQMAALRRALAGCAVLVGAGRPVVGPTGASYGLPGLSESDAFTLLARDLGRFLSEAELPGVRALVAAVAGRPLALRQAAALVRHDGRGFDELARQVAVGPAALDELAISTLVPRAKRVLAVLALLGGALLPARLVAAMAGVEHTEHAPYTDREFESLLDRGLAERRDDRFGLPSCRVEPYWRLLHDHLDLGRCVRVLAGWIAARDPAGEATRDAAEAALIPLALAAERGEGGAAVRLAAVVERVLFLQGHWRACSRALGHGLAAARRTGDAAAEAYFSHQQGTLHFLEGRGEAAGKALSRALDVRTRLGDVAGAAVTRANLAFAAPEPAVPAKGARPAHARRALIAVAVTAAVLLLGVCIGAGVGEDGHTGTSASGGSALPGTGVDAPPTGPTGSSAVTEGRTSATGAPSAAPSPGASTSAPGSSAQPTGTPAVKPPLIKGVADYGDVEANSAEQPIAEFTVTNPNDRPLRLAGIALTGSTDFRFTDDACSDGTPQARLAPGAACTVSVQFTPTSLGRRTGSLTAAFGDRAAVTDLHGNGFATIDVAITPDSDGDLPGRVDVTADGTTTVCDHKTCKVRYYDADGPLVLSARGTDGDYDAHWSGDGCPGSGSQCTPEAGGNISASVRFTAN